MLEIESDLEKFQDEEVEKKLSNALSVEGTILLLNNVIYLLNSLNENSSTKENIND